MGELFFSAQYQQEPIPLAGNIIKAEWFKEYDVAPTRGYADLLVISIDTAMKGEQLSDFSDASAALLVRLRQRRKGALAVDPIGLMLLIPNERDSLDIRGRALS